MLIEQIFVTAITSNIRGLREVGGKGALNPHSLKDYFRFTYIPGPKTIWSDIASIVPGQCLEFDRMGRQQDLYDLQSSISAFVPEPLTDLLPKKIAKGVIGESKIGILLSGGIDSGLVAALSSKALEDKCLKSFTITSDDRKYDESDRAVLMARHLGIENHMIDFHKEFNPDKLFSFLTKLGQPYADSSVIVSLTAFDFIKRNFPNYKVVLTGDGGDEIWGGYNKHKILKIPSSSALERLSSLFAQVYFCSLGRLNFRIIPVKILKVIKAYTWMSRYMGILSLGFDRFSLSRLFKEKINDGYTEKASNLKDAISLDHKYSLCYDLNVKTDSASMSSSIEARSPLLDLDLYRKNSLQFSKKTEIANFFKDLFPENYIKLPKRGFALNVRSFLLREFRKYFDEYRAPAKLSEIPGIDAVYAEKLFRDFLKRDSGKDFEIFSLIVASIWFNHN